MSRPPKARQATLGAARRIVASCGVAHLTYDALARESGITRGGIVYHFPSRKRLLSALLEDDLKEWDRLSAQAVDGTSASPEFEGHVRSSLDSHPTGAGSLAAGLLSAARSDPDILRIVQNHERQRFARWTWDDEGVMRYLLLLAAEGAFWRAHFGLPPDEEDVRMRLHSMMARMLEKISRSRSSEA